MAKSNAGSSNAVQTTFTKQKRELAKANELINQIRAQEKRLQRFTPDGKLQTEERESYLLATPQEIANKVLTIVVEVVSQHGARQVANSANKGKFAFMGIEAELTVPQLRALQDAAVTLRNLVDKLPMENKRYIPNEKIDGLPAFATPLVENKEKRSRVVPYEEKDSTRIRTYQEDYEEVVSQTREVTVDYGLPVAKITALREMVGDLDAAIQVAIDEANAKPHANDPVLNDVVAKVADAFRKEIDG
ncbi:MAG: hypothetical protein IIU43_06675 [Thermoguttaceae bacterium]|nr:hypothetical protein [Thermoguttaceae bacterium]MBQ5367143.1 hypothetical protein [Thermoguttaceae bacterium]